MESDLSYFNVGVMLIAAGTVCVVIGTLIVAGIVTDAMLVKGYFTGAGVAFIGFGIGGLILIYIKRTKDSQKVPENVSM